jgi:hypothetical protein
MNFKTMYGRHKTARFDRQVEAYEYATKLIDESTRPYFGTAIVPGSIYVRQTFWKTDFVVSWTESA